MNSSQEPAPGNHKYFCSRKEIYMAGVIDIGHVGFTVTDIDKTLHFYCDLLGGRLLTETIDEGPELGTQVMGLIAPHPQARLRVAMVELGGTEIEFIQYLDPETTPYPRDPSVAGSAHVAVNVDDIDAMYEKLSSEGVVFHTKINLCVRDGELVWRWVYARDPDGICCEIVQLNYDSDYVKKARA